MVSLRDKRNISRTGSLRAMIRGYEAF